MLTPPVLLMAKLLVLFLIVRGAWADLSDHFLPFLPWFDRLGEPAQFRAALQWAFAAGCAGVLLNRWARAGALLLGVTLLVSILSSRLLFSNHRTFVACLLLLIGLQAPGRSRWLLQAQVCLLYLGAGLNKLADPDWYTGRYFEFWTSGILHHQAYQHLADALPPMALSRLFGCATIAIELGLAAGLMVPRARAWAVWAGVAFHTAMLLFTGGTISVIFYYAMLVAYLAFLPWPDLPVEVHMDLRNGLWRRLQPWLARLDLDGRFRWTLQPSSPLTVNLDGKTLTGLAAVRALAIYNPVFLLLFALTIVRPDGPASWAVYWIALSLVLVATWPQLARET